MSRRRAIGGLWVLANLSVFLIAANWIILQKEELLANGRTILLPAGRYDPRSLMQGDFMALSYPICRAIERQLPANAHGDGLAVIRVGSDGVGRFLRLRDPENRAELATDEHLLYFRIRQSRGTRVRVAAESFFFQEGLAAEFERASFAELKVTKDGRTLLVALCDDARRRIGPQ